MAKTFSTSLLDLVDALMESLMNSYDCNKIFGDDSMIKDYDKEYCGTTQEVMFELKLNTNKFFKKFKESQNR